MKGWTKTPINYESDKDIEDFKTQSNNSTWIKDNNGI